MNRYIILVCMCFFASLSWGQILEEKNEAVKVKYNADSVRAELDKMPYFTLFRDNYFSGGIPLGTKPTGHNSDVKFQLSISQRLTKSNIQYTQKAFWDVFRESLPMRDLNFNPGIGLGHLIIRHNKYIGKAYLMLEHESNGKDSIDSRSWNKITFSWALVLNDNWETQFKTWIPIIDGENNKDILKYNGIFQFAVNYRTCNKRLQIGALITQRKDWFGFNTQLELSYKFNKRENQFFFIQYYNGYGENLLEYNQYKNMLRVGFVIKPQDFSLY